MPTTLPPLIENPKDGSVLALVPAGEFIMGGTGEYDGKPQHRVFVPDFYMSLYCVTNAQFARFVAETGYQAQGSWKNYAAGKDDHPVVAVTWFDAVAYCDWAGLRLPTEAEWEKASRGTDGRVYPWGNTWDVKRCQNYDNRGGYSDTCPVDGYPESCSVYGMYQMSGNVWEWCSSLHKPYPYRADDGREERGKNVAGDLRVRRGGSWLLRYVTLFRCANRLRYDPDYWWLPSGVRCACVREGSPLVFRSAAMPTKLSLDHLITTLRGRSESARQAAVEALVQQGKAAIAPLLDALSDPHWEVRRAAVEALGRINDPQAMIAVFRIAAAGSHIVHLQQAAVEAWERLNNLLNNPDAVEPLCGLLMDADSAVRRAAATALGAIGLPDALPALRKARHWTRGTERKTFDDAIAHIEEASKETRTLPRPAGQPVRDVSTLPIPAAPQTPQTDNLPIPSSPLEEAKG